MKQCAIIKPVLAIAIRSIIQEVVITMANTELLWMIDPSMVSEDKQVHEYPMPLLMFLQKDIDLLS